MEDKLKIKAVQTVIPMKPTDPRKYLHVSLLPENVGSSIYKTCFKLIFCYKNSSEEENGSLVAGWIKETLAMALDQQPILAGRLKKQQEEEKEEMEIVSNDSGIRLIEAQIDVTLQDFLDLKKNQKKEFEDVLVFWKDIDHEINPQFSPLFYIQVTNFKCGGYSIGISCSLILIDPFSMINFLKSWTKIHLQLISNSTNTPLFYRQNHETTSSYIINQSIGQPTKKTCNSQTSIFNIMGTKILNNNIDNKNLAKMCIFEGEKKFGIKPISRFVLYVKQESLENVKVMKFDKESEVVEKKPFVSKCENLDDLVGNDICFIKDNKAVYCSSWINVVDDEAVVIVLEDEDDGYRMKIITTLPVES